ncbi:MAG: PIG-L family deacetylase [Chloroflexales bacterium]|nr:PIG-L family deacetylase [Chloroflexales bacterium]
MRIDTLDQIGHDYRYIYLSPHLDDAALSCGGTILKQRAADERVLVVTLCTAAPAADAVFSTLAQAYHQVWELNPAEVVTARLREDELAMERLGVDHYWTGLLDAIYRYPKAYHNHDTLFGTPAPDDPLFSTLRQFVSNLREHMPHATFYAPLGVGNHVDHQITFQAAIECAGPNLALYEDFPYVTKPEALERRTAAIDLRLHHRTEIIDSTLPSKIAAIDSYASQLNELFGSAAAMARAVRDYAKIAGIQTSAYTERYWALSQTP